MHVSRRHALGILGASAFARSIFAQDARVKNLLTPAAKQAIERGLAYLASRQTEDGGFGNGGNSRDVAIAGLAGMAFMSTGNMPGRGRYGLQVNRCAEYIVDSARENGFLVAAGSNMHGPMYGHGFATLFLAEAYGMSQQVLVRPVLAEAVKLIVTSQNKEGGWRYAPNGADADLSVTICQVMALRAAKNAGIHVPNETIDRCVDYVKRSQNPDGGFMYMLSAGGPSAFPRSAAGVVALYSAGIYQGNEVNAGVEYLLKQPPDNGQAPHDTHFFYGHYYAVQAMHHAGGESWQKWYPAIHDVLLGRQKDDGSWFDMICPEYATAMACIILQMPNSYLPIFHR